MFSLSPRTPDAHPDQATEVHRDHVGATPTHDEQHTGHSGHGGHGLMMLICCIPVVLLAVTLIASGRFSLGALLPALACVAMMGVMMLVMPGNHRHH